MKSWYALARREFLEHRGAFVVAPAVIVAVVIAAVLVAFFSISVSEMRTNVSPSANMLYQTGYLGSVGLWVAYLMIGLFFYFADAFSADRKHNSLLFWRSMPLSDLKLLASKFVSAGTVFPLLIFGWLLVTSVVIYWMTVMLSIRVPEFAAPAIGPALADWLQITLGAIAFFVLSLLWYAPFFGWVGLLSTIFRGWSIPLTFAIPAGAALFEVLLTWRGAEPHSALADFLGWRLQGFFGEPDIDRLIETGSVSAADMIATMVANIHWPALAAGLVFAAVATWVASEYRRRRIII